MSSQLVLFASDVPGADLDWREVSPRGDVTAAGTAPLDGIASMATGPVVLVLPGTLVTSHDLTLNTRSERQALEAAPFAIEDQVASELDQVHVALSPSDGDRTAYVLERELLENWLEALASHDLSAKTVLPDYLALPEPADEQIHMVDLPGRVVLRDGNWGAAIDHDFGRPMLDALLAGRGEDKTATLLDGDGLDRLARAAVDADISLLQGAYAPRRETAPIGWNRLAQAGGLAAAAAIAVVAYTVAEGFVLRGQAQTVRAEAEAMFRTAFPEVERIVNLRAQLRSVDVQPGSGAPDFLILSGWLTRAAEAEPDVVVEAIRYDHQTGEFVANIGFRDYDALGRFRSAIEAAGGVVEEGGSRQASNDMRTGEITVRRP